MRKRGKQVYTAQVHNLVTKLLCPGFETKHGTRVKWLTFENVMMKLFASGNNKQVRKLQQRIVLVWSDAC